MSDASELNEPPVKKKSKLPSILGIVFLIIGASVGFSIVSTGLILGDNAASEVAGEKVTTERSERITPTFMALDPILVTISQNGENRLVRFTAQLEVNPDNLQEVELVKPRIVDILNGYLRALNIEELEASNAITKIRTQMLHRARIVTGENRINDLLVMELIIN